MKDLKIVNGRIPDFENDSWIHTDIPVSYTHLDVYKRQADNRI